MNEKEILRRTSRTFGLTLRLLPHAVRRDASLGYLLARATDTIADDPGTDPAKRADTLRSVAVSLHEPSVSICEAVRHASSVSAAERCLLEELPSLWARMQSRPKASRDRLRRVMGHILCGQIFDLERFRPGAPALSAEELESYTYLVAGSVGEFWTELCAHELPGFATDPEDVQRTRGRHYGQALQLVNILRDRDVDVAAGRVYVARGEVADCRFAARDGLHAGAAYCAALRSGRLRYATLLPALLGWRTLAMLEGSEKLVPRKISRSEVRSWMLRALPVWISSRAVFRLASKASGATPER